MAAGAMKSEITFSLAELDARKAGYARPSGLAPTGKTWSDFFGEYVQTLPHKQVPEKLSFSEMGGIPVMLRSSVVRIAFMKLAATGVLALAVAAFSDSDKVAFSCALAAAVNLVAVIHYGIIWRIRAQDLSQSYIHLASARDEQGTFVGREGEKFEGAKIYQQEFMVDGLRYSDWAVRCARCHLRASQR
jgi:hypothetical protein